MPIWDIFNKEVRPMNRKIESILTSKPTIEGAGVNLRRAFGYMKFHYWIHSCFLTISVPMIQKTILPDFRGILTGALKRSLICWKAQWNTGIAWEIKALLELETSSG